MAFLIFPGVPLGKFEVLTQGYETFQSLALAGVIPAAPLSESGERRMLFRMRCTGCGKVYAMSRGGALKLWRNARDYRCDMACGACMSQTAAGRAVWDNKYAQAKAAWEGLPGRVAVARTRVDSTIIAGALRLFDPLAYHICQEWNTLDGFIASMGLPPSEIYVLGRLDVHKGFFPDNCAWMTKSEISRRRVKRDGVRGRKLGAGRFVELAGFGLTPYAWVEGTHLDPGPSAILDNEYNC